MFWYPLTLLALLGALLSQLAGIGLAAIRRVDCALGRLDDMPLTCADEYSGTGVHTLTETRMAGAWRSVRAMAPLLAPSSYTYHDVGAMHMTNKARPMSGAGGEGDEDTMRDILAVCGMDDVHVCRARNATRLTRAFSLGVSKVGLVLTSTTAHGPCGAAPSSSVSIS